MINKSQEFSLSAMLQFLLHEGNLCIRNSRYNTVAYITFSRKFCPRQCGNTLTSDEQKAWQLVSMVEKGGLDEVDYA
jgi:hypothetical protein